jgi:hypothetical protein
MIRKIYAAIGRFGNNRQHVGNSNVGKLFGHVPNMRKGSQKVKTFWYINHRRQDQLLYDEVN